MAHLSLDEFTNFWKYYKGEEHQRKAIEIMYGQMHAGLLNDEHAWVKQYRTPPKKADVKNPLDVPWQSQHDNISGYGYRECFSSSCAMVAMYYGKVKNDDEYNAIRQKFGDSTDAGAQMRTLHSLGLEAKFVTNATIGELKAHIDMGRPIPCGWLHKGHVSNPQGGGHYSVVVGYDDKVGCWIMNDPNGEANLVGGGYISHANGDHLDYSYKNWNPRWVVEGDGSGWLMDIRLPQ